MIKLVGRAGFEPATFRLSVERSSRAELPALVVGIGRLMVGWFIRIFVSFLMGAVICCVGGWARSLARIKVSAFGAGDRGFKSHRARYWFRPFKIGPSSFLFGCGTHRDLRRLRCRTKQIQIARRARFKAFAGVP